MMSQSRQTSNPRKSHLPEYTTESIVIGVSLGLYGFIKLTEEVVDGDTRGFDRDILLMFRNPDQLLDPVGPAWLEVVVRDITAMGGLITLALLTLAACGYLLLTQRYRLAMFVAACVAGGCLVNTLLKSFIERPRPNIVPHGTSAALSSFPSGHAMMSAVVFLTLGAILAYASNTTRIKIYILSWSVLLTVLVGTSRVYLGVHWPTDIIAGWIGGATWALLCLLVSRVIFPANNK